MDTNIVTFPSRGNGGPPPEAPDPDHWRSRERVQRDIDAHVAARKAYGKAVAWEAACEAENLGQAQLEEGRRRTAEAYSELQECGRNLVVCMPTDPRALVDLLLYLEQHFSVLPEEISGRSLAFDLLKTVRLSLRRIENYGKRGPRR
jgi:hypothetical protein